MRKHVVVIGAGIVGVSTAIWLRRFGMQVTLVDRDAPGLATSFGNAGLLASCAIVPVTEPSVLTKAPRYVLDKNSPLFLRWSYLPKLAPWLFGYLRHATDRDTRRISAALANLIRDSVAQHQALVQGLGAAETFVTPSDYVFAYKDRPAFDADRYGWDIRREHGFVPDMVEGPQVQEFDPAYGSDIACLAVVRDHGFITDPGGYVTALAEAFRDMGGVIRQASVQDVTLSNGQVSRVETDQGPIDCDSAVLTAGAWSGPLAHKLRLKLRLESERGYHILFEDPQGAPQRPTMISAAKFVATPMRMGLRCAGIVELGGLEAGPSQAPLDLLRRSAKQALPNLSWSGEQEWMGHRPATIDSLPMIGQIGRSGVYTGFGHQHVGLTGGPKTGRLLASLIAGQPPNIDLDPFAPERFGASR